MVAAFTLLVALVGAVPGKVYNTAGGPVAGKVNVHIVPHTHDGTYGLRWRIRPSCCQFGKGTFSCGCSPLAAVVPISVHPCVFVQTSVG